MGIFSSGLNIYFKSSRYIFVSIIIFFLSIISPGMVAKAQYSIPNYIRVGLYFGNSAASAFTVSAQNGLIFGEYTGNDFKVLYEDTSSNRYHIRKDSYYYQTNSMYVEYSPASTPSGKTYGPYHVFIGGPFGDLNSIIGSILLYRQKGIDAFPVYNGSWEIWAGFYKSADEAHNSITAIENLLGRGVYKVIDPSYSRIVISTEDGQTIMVYSPNSGAFQIRPNNTNNPYMLTLNNANYRGYLEVRRFSDSDMTVINILPLEEYLCGVVPIEMGYSSPIEALKAQAVASRTYAIASMGKYSKWFFDLCNTTNSQVYRGFDSERQSTNQAVNETRGQILTYNGQPISTYYFSTSGGRTEDNVNVWGDYQVPYLISVDDSYEPENAKYRNWEVTLSAAKIKEYTGNALGEILSVTATRFSNSGRVIELVVKGTKGERIYKKDGCRTVFGLRSQMYKIVSDKPQICVVGSESISSNSGLDNRYILTASGPEVFMGSSFNVIDAGGKMTEVSQTAQSYTFIGHGWGHGVGMSQEGAKGMANAGFNYEQILTHYYTGAALVGP